MAKLTTTFTTRGTQVRFFFDNGEITRMEITTMVKDADGELLTTMTVSEDNPPKSYAMGRYNSLLRSPCERETVETSAITR